MSDSARSSHPVESEQAGSPWSSSSLLPCGGYQGCDSDGHAPWCHAGLPTLQQLELLQAFADAATPGPWVVETNSGYITGHITAEAHDYAGNLSARRDSVTHPHSMTVTDAQFIALARHAIPALVTYARRLGAPSFEQLLRDPTQQLDRNGEVAASVLAAQRLADIHSPARCPHHDTSTHPPGTAGGSSVTVCNDCGIYL